MSHVTLLTKPDVLSILTLQRRRLQQERTNIPPRPQSCLEVGFEEKDPSEPPARREQKHSGRPGTPCLGGTRPKRETSEELT